jgi:hypothetical protein
VSTASKALSAEGPLQASHKVPARIPLSDQTTASFATYAGLEESVLAELIGGRPAAEALAVPAGLPRLRVGSWAGASDVFSMVPKTTRSGHALGWFGAGIREAMGRAEGSSLARPWRDAFDRVESTGAPATAESVIGDYLADHLWGLTWVHEGAFDRARVVASALGCIASTIARRLVAEGSRPDRAAAEAVMIVEIGEKQPAWRLVARAMSPAPLGRE